jgi:hypothetical protein
MPFSVRTGSSLKWLRGIRRMANEISPIQMETINLLHLDDFYRALRAKPNINE